jgi:hypothetical protein
VVQSIGVAGSARRQPPGLQHGDEMKWLISGETIAASTSHAI